MYKKIGILLVLTATAAQAGELVHTFQSPAFIPGNGYSSHVLAIEQLNLSANKKSKTIKKLKPKQRLWLKRTRTYLSSWLTLRQEYMRSYLNS